MDSNEWPQIHHHKLQPSDLMVSLPLLLPSTTTTTTTPTTSSSSSSTKAAATMDQLVAGTVKPQPDPTLKCPRCDSNNTKFCYYNNYSLSQPRHFCKACKRYWTKGGTLRNVPVGGGCRKNKRQVKRSSTNSSSTSTHHLGLDPINATTTQSMILTSSSTMQNPNLFMNNQDFMHLNSSLMTSLKSAISGLGFPHDKEECNFMQDHQLQGGYTHMTTHETGSIFPTSLPNMGQHVGGDHHGLNGSVIMASEPHWIRQIHQHNLFVPLDDELRGPKSAGNIDDHHNGNSMRNMDMKIEDHDHGVSRINMGGQNIHEWHIPNLNVFEANNITSDQAAAGLFWNTSNIGPWTDVNNYGSSSVASML